MKNTLNLLNKFENRNNQNLHKIVSFSDGSGRVINCEDDADEQVFEFETQEQLETFLKN